MIKHKNIFRLVFLFLFITNFLKGQDNLIENPDFLNDVNQWNTSGDATLSHINNGALTSGAARLQVTQVGNFNNAQLRSAFLNIPQDSRGKMFYLSLYARTNNNTSNRQFRIRINQVDINGNESNQTFDEVVLSAEFQDFSVPVFVEENIVSIQVSFQCGLQIGSYFFDDVTFVLAHVEPESIEKFDHWEARQFSKPQDLELQSLGAGNAEVQVTLNTNKIIAPVLSTQFGVNSNFRSGNDLLDRVGLYESFGSFRFPAGSGSNRYFWDCNIPAEFEIPVTDICGTANQSLSPQNFISFKDNAQGEATIVVNYMYARYGVTEEGTREARVQQAADYAADLVHFFNVENEASIKYWEIGNECYGPWETGYDVNGSVITGKEYGEDFQIFAAAMKAVDENIKLGAVLWHKGFEWNNQVLKEVKDHADFLIVHHYFDLEDGDTAAEALFEIKKDMQEIQTAATYNTGKSPGYFPVVFTEYNVQGDYATSIANGLFVAETLATVIENSFSMSTIWVNEWNIEGNHSKGLLAQNDSDQSDYTPRPTYTPFYFYNKYFGDRMIETTVSGNDQVRAYASTFSSGEIGIVLVNYSSSSKKVSFDFTDNSISADSIYWHSVHADNQNAGNKKFYVNGQTSSTLGGGPKLDLVPAFVAEYAQNNYLTLPKFSATYVVLNTEVITSINDSDHSASEILLYPNPTNGQIVIDKLSEPIDDFKIFNIEGKILNKQVSIVENNDQRMIIDGSSLSSGIYFLKIKNSVLKIIKQ